MAKKPRYPLTATMLRGGQAWFYQSRTGICVVAEQRTPSGLHIATTQCNISWAKLCAAVDNHRGRRHRE